MMFFLLYSYFSYFQQNLFIDYIQLYILCNVLHTVGIFTRSDNTETIFQGNTKNYFSRITNYYYLMYL